MIGNGAGSTGVVTVVSGTLNVPGTPILLGNSATALATNNLNGGTEISRQVKLGAAGAVSIFNFNGGTLKAASSALPSTFMTGLTTANVRDNGGAVDYNGFDITIGQALLHSSLAGDAATDGGLTVTNTTHAAGSLTLTGANTYNGPTRVSGGKLVTTTASTGAGSYSVSDGGALEVQVAAAGKSLTNSSLTLGTAGNVTNNFTLGANASTTVPAVLVTGALSLNGVVNVTVSGTGLTGPGTYLLMSYGSITGSGSFVANTLPAVSGFIATLTNDVSAKQLKLVYTQAPQSVKWATGNGNWD
ncbi:MAG: autotransporter-associated beta strand repeat-containing protein, partial [Verrucomicrobia bacterium]|nr:autotransporter-associated beta strand repeat-containing protein [Verrucomicrobiota bacterium]